MFALCGLDSFPFSVNLKCLPERALELRERHSGIIPGWHMNKKHWNTVSVDGSVSDDLILRLTDESYDLVIASLPRKLREEIAAGN